MCKRKKSVVNERNNCPMPKPTRCGIIIDPGCSANCVFCGSIARKGAAEIREQVKGISRDLVEFRKNGYENIEISGGDPIEYNKLIPLIKQIRNKGFNDILLSTHGRRLADKGFAERLIEAGVTCFRIPLYGSKGQIHDSVTRAQGSLLEAVKGMRNLKEINPHVGLMAQTLVLEQNKEDIFAIFQLALKLKVDHFAVSVACVADGDYSYYVPYKDLKNYVNELFDYVSMNKIGNISFCDIPHCVFGRWNDSVVMTMPPELGSHSQPKGFHKSNERNIPAYRLKTKVESCRNCEVSDQCQGFYLNDVKVNGIGDLKPIGCCEQRNR